MIELQAELIKIDIKMNPRILYSQKVGNLVKLETYVHEKLEIVYTLKNSGKSVWPIST